MAATGNPKDSDTDTDTNGHDDVDHCATSVHRTTSAVHSHIAASKQLADALTLRTAKRSLAMLHQQTNGGVKSNKPAVVAAVESLQTQTPQPVLTTVPPTAPSTVNGTTRRKSSFPTLEKLPLFYQFRKRVSSAPAIHSITPTPTAGQKDARPMFVKSSSISRLFGNTYSTAVATDAASASVDCSNGTTIPGKTTQSSSSNTITAERFHACTNDADQLQLLNDEHCVSSAASNGDSPSASASALLYGDDFDVALNPFRSLSRGLGRLFFKKSYSVKISEPDPEFKVAYLGNVLTGWAKGESCMEKPLATLWRNYTQNSKPDVSMRVRICPSGLKATTRQHGLTEYWSHRITFCSAPRNYPKVFCWIYRHEGRKLKHELRCHAVLCTKEPVAESIAKMLQENLCRALREFKRDKMNKQNARLSLVNSVYDNPSMPQRKIMLSVGGNNYRPPLERSKSAPRLMVIEEQGEEPDEADEDGDGNAGDLPASRAAAVQRPSCCTVDPLYPAMTLGRRKCRRGHSIRRTGNRHQTIAANRGVSGLMRAKVAPHASLGVRFRDEVAVADGALAAGVDLKSADDADQTNGTAASSADDVDRLRDSGDDLDKLLLGSNYDTESPLADELLSYYDMKFMNNNTSTGSMIDLHPEDDLEDEDADVRTVHFRRQNSRRFEPVRTSLSLDNLDSYCADDDDGDYEGEVDEADGEEDETPSTNGGSALYFSQSDILGSLQRISVHHKHQDSGYAAEDPLHEPKKQAVNTAGSFDSDEGSISSGFETVSTTNGVDSVGKVTFINSTSSKASGSDDSGETENANSLEECSSVCTTPLATCKKPASASVGRSFRATAAGVERFSDDSEQSDVSDESGYVEYQQQKDNKATTNRVARAGGWNVQATATIELPLK